MTLGPQQIDQNWHNIEVHLINAQRENATKNPSKWSTFIFLFVLSLPLNQFYSKYKARYIISLYIICKHLNENSYIAKQSFRFCKNFQLYSIFFTRTK